jgi:hypothetical protein
VSLTAYEVKASRYLSGTRSNQEFLDLTGPGSQSTLACSDSTH